jgi:glycosyltransferase involved in cell wall biosynthesis
MKVLQVCNDYFGGVFYEQMFDGLRDRGVESTVLVFHRTDQRRLFKARLEDRRSCDVILVELNALRSLAGRLAPGVRNGVLHHALERRVRIQDFDLVHAHTLYSNGSFARFLHRRYGTPYVASVRNTDVNKVMALQPYHRSLLREIVLGSRAVLFLSPTYRDYVGRLLRPRERAEVSARSRVIPNPLADDWFEEIGAAKRLSREGVIRILYVGEVSPNKRLDFLLDVFEGHAWRGRAFEVTVVGKVRRSRRGGWYYRGFVQRARRRENVTVLPETSDPDTLRRHYRQADLFFMASRHETFGLVYVEAMSQGTPILYGKGQGIDGFFPEGVVGFPVVSGDVGDARARVNALLDRYEDASANCIRLAGRFSRPEVARELVGIYAGAVEAAATPYV